jgi:hypothetical protein
VLEEVTIHTTVHDKKVSETASEKHRMICRISNAPGMNALEQVGLFQWIDTE